MRGDEQILSWGGGRLSPIAPSRESTRNRITFASVLSIIDGTYVITKTRIGKRANYTVRERCLYNQCLDSLCMHAIYTVYTGKECVGIIFKSYKSRLY